MGWKQKSMGRIAAITPSRRLSNAKMQTKVGVRFNRMPYSAQVRAAGLRGIGPQVEATT